jgi:hypothetical protein
MKRIPTILAAILTAAASWAQAPEKMTYQAVVRDAGNKLLVNQQIGMQVSILQGTADGTVAYTETQTPTSNANGLVSIEIGGQAGFETIDWSDGPYFLKTETDPTGGTNYTISGTSQLLSVPYAFHATSAERLTEAVAETDPVYSAWNKDYSDLISTPAIVDSISAVLDTTTRFLSAEIDGDINNELQNLSYSGNSLAIENGNSVIINESKWTSSGDNISFSGGLLGIGHTNTPLATLDIYDNVGYPFFKFVSEDNVYTQWISDRTGVDDYQLGIDGGNNKFIIANTTQVTYPIVLHGNNIGINTLDPEASLHINDFMKLEPRNTAPSSPTEGMIYYDGVSHTLRVYDGTSWVDL